MNNEKRSEPRVVYEFGEFRLDAARHLIYAGDSSTPLPIKPKVLEALLYFVEHPGELLDKDRLLAELWPGLVVEENGLTQLISSLRRVLREAPGENRYLATVPGRGYRFVAGVSRVPDHEQHPPAPAPSPMPPVAEPPAPASMQAEGTEPHPSARYWLRRRSTLVLAIVALIAAIGTGLGVHAGLARWRTARESVATTGAASATPARLSSGAVAVLPFENLSADVNDAYVAFGVAESVLHRLAAVDGLTLIARTSSFAMSEQPRDALEIGRALNARYLVEGSVQRSGERLRVTAQLIDATTAGHLWSLRFDRAMDDIFAVEDEIAQNIATALEVSLSNDKHPYARFGTDAYLEYLHGRALLATNRVEDAERAIEHFSRAIEMAPEFAAAYAALADTHWQSTLLQQTNGTGLLFMIRSDGQRERLAAAAAEAQPLLDRALLLDDTLAEAYVLRADLKMNDGDDAGARADYEEGLARNPSYGAGHERYASFLWHTADGGEDAWAEIDKAIRLDPLAPRNYYLRGAMQWSGGRDDEAEPDFLKALTLDPDYHPALQRLSLIRWYDGHFADAVRLGERALAIDPPAEWIRWPLAQIYLEVGEVDAARSVLLEAPETVPPYDWLAMCLYERQPQRAAALLRADPSYRYRIDADIRPYVLRDAAWASGRFEQAKQELDALPSHHGEDKDGFTLVALGQVSFALGDRGAAESLARDALEREPGPIYAHAAALTLLAQRDAALDLLEEEYARGNRKRWWYVFARDRGFDALRDDPRFQALAAKAKAHAAAERTSLQKMRERGRVPQRTANPSGEKRGPC